VRSASRLSPLLIAAAVTTLAGCATTQQTAARLRVNDARIRASQLPTEVLRDDRSIEVLGVSVVGGPSGSAMVVTLRNLAGTPVSDLPISVGLIDGGHRRYLNGAAGSDYFQTHLPAISRRGTLTWVFTTPRRLPGQTRPFAVVGVPAAPPLSLPRTLPDLAARLTRASGALRGGELQISVQNRSSLPQYQLPVYATASRGGHYVAAGQATIEQLDGGASSRLELHLTGDTNGASVAIEAPPTIFS